MPQISVLETQVLLVNLLVTVLVIALGVVASAWPNTTRTKPPLGCEEGVVLS